ncbi:aspartate aminotransferase family protein, partial [candidate division KSB1 bacterium]|nr:aspartate aminotransferase family protein [candidate division KSB1 bacterium]
MDLKEFRRLGHKMVDWIADYYENVDQYPVLSQVKPGDIRAKLPASPPQKGDKLQKVFDDLKNIILPGITHWQSPNFFAFFPANTSPPAILGELLSAGLGVQGMLWATSPACTELETHVMDWLVDMLALPPQFKSNSSGGGVIQDTASSAALVALLTARERATHYRSNEHGCDGRLVVYASNQVHSSVEKAVRMAGIGLANLRLIDTDETFAMRPEALSQQIIQDKEAGLQPFFICATVGTT